MLALKAADVLHNVQSILMDRSEGQDLSNRFNAPPEHALRYYQDVASLVSRRMPLCLRGTTSRLPKALQKSVHGLGKT